MKPIIAITTYGRYEEKIRSPHYPQHFCLPTLYVEAVRRAGGHALLLPPGETDLASVLGRVDGLILSGGADVNPAEYQGNSQHPNLTVLDLERDASELEMVRRLADVPRPVLCICRGLQVLNVALGGSLMEHMADFLPEDIHRGEDDGWAVQEVSVLEGSQLAQVMQIERVATYSGHHQAIKQLAPGLKVSAVADDGIIEAVEHVTLPWLLGVQWHPEVSAADDPSQQRLFDVLVEQAALYAGRRDG